MSYISRMLSQAAVVSRLKKDDRRFYIGAIGIRSDGTKVRACNGNPKEPTRQHHCEFRLSRKLDKGAVVFVSRTLGDGSLGCAKPCNDCEKVLRTVGVRKVYYSVPNGFGCLELY